MTRTRWRACCVRPWPGEVLEDRAGEIAVGFAALLTRQAAWRHRRGGTITVLPPPAGGDDHGALARAGAPQRVRRLHGAGRAPRRPAAVGYGVGGAAGGVDQAGAGALRPALGGRDRGAAAALRRGTVRRARAAVSDARPGPGGRRAGAGVRRGR